MGVFVCVFVSVCMCVVCMCVSVVGVLCVCVSGCVCVCCVGVCLGVCVCVLCGYVGVWLGAHFSFCSLQEGSNRVLTVSQQKFCADGNIAGTQPSIIRMTEM